jgi:hypothetical protein
MNGFLRGTLIFLSIILIVILLSIRLNSQATLTKVLAKMEQFCSIKENSCDVGNYIMARNGRVYTFTSEVDKYRVVTIKLQKDGSLYVSKSVEGE